MVSVEVYASRVHVDKKSSLKYLLKRENLCPVFILLHNNSLR